MTPDAARRRSNPARLSATPPTDVCIPTSFSGLPIQYFDDFSWRSFVAMVWPALQGQRGTPDTSQQVGAVGGPLVFETFKADWEIFQPAPTPSPMPQPPPPPQPNNVWNTFEGQVPCPNVSSVGFNDLVLASFSKFGNLQQAGFGNLLGPLVAQNQTYAQFTTAKVMGLPLLVIGNAANSNIIKALLGQAPFDGSQFQQMPADGPPFLTAAQVQPISDWINNGCPQ